MKTLIDFILEHGDAVTAIVAVIALVQPWGIAAWKRFVRSGHIDTYQSGTIEIGYSTFGPTVALLGTLKASNRDFFVNQIRLTVLKEKDHSRHDFEWCVFRSQKLTLGKGEETALELPYGFMVMHSQPYRYNILFYDQSRLEDMRPSMISLRQAWNQHRLDPQHASQDLKTAYTSFNRSQTHVSAYTNLDRLIYWEPGSYRLSMFVETEKGESLMKNWSFTLSAEDDKNLRYNPLIITQEICEQVNLKYNFAYPKYH